MNSIAPSGAPPVKPENPTAQVGSPAAQNQVKAALLFVYRQVLWVDLPWLGEVAAAKDTQRLSVVSAR